MCWYGSGDCQNGCSGGENCILMVSSGSDIPAWYNAYQLSNSMAFLCF